MNTQEVNDLIMNILEVRKAMLKKFKYRRVAPLSRNAKRALAKRKLSQSFWNRFQAKYKDTIRYRRQGRITLQRAVSCTRVMATNHLDDLARELISAGIFTDAKQEAPGKWTGKIDTTRIFNHDETPQFINFGVDGTSSGKVFGSVGKNETCQRLTKENRECPTVHPIVSCDGKKAVCQVIFGRKGIDSNMINNKIPNLVVSTTPHGVQDHTSLLFAYKRFDKYITDNAIQKPVVVLSDGHSSRFNKDTFNFLRKTDIRLFVSPPDTTGVTQLLDQVNKSLHEAYRKKKKELYASTDTVGIKEFMHVLGEIWPDWVSEESLIKAAKRVGISTKGLNVDNMQTWKFEQAEGLFSQESEENLNTSNVSKSSSVIESPKDIRKYTKAYYKAKCDAAENIIHGLVNETIQLEDVPSLFNVEKLPKKAPKPKTRLTQMHGSMCGDEALQVMERIEQEKAAKEQASEDAKRARNCMTEAFFKCKMKCVCNETPCAAIAFKECSICNKVYKSQCMKAACKSKGREMIKPASITTAPRKKTTKANQQVSDYSSETTEPSDVEMHLLSTTDSDHLSSDFHTGSTDDSDDEHTASLRRQFREELLQKVLRQKWTQYAKKRTKHSSNRGEASSSKSSCSVSSKIHKMNRRMQARKRLPSPVESFEGYTTTDDTDVELQSTSTLCSKRIKRNPKTRAAIAEAGSPVLTSTPTETFNAGDYVKVLTGDYSGWYAVIVCYLEELKLYKINFYKPEGKYWVFQEGDTELVTSDDLKVAKYKMDKRGHVYFY